MNFNSGENLMNSREGRKEIEDTIDYAKVSSFSSQISVFAQRCAVISNKLQDINIPEEEREMLGKELSELIEKGSELSEERTKIFMTKGN